MQKAVRKLRVVASEHGEWTAASSAELYNIRNWGADYFDINEAGEVTVRVPANGGAATVSLMEIIRGMQQRGMTMPVLLRLDNLLDGLSPEWRVFMQEMLLEHYYAVLRVRDRAAEARRAIKKKPR